MWLIFAIIIAIIGCICLSCALKEEPDVVGMTIVGVIFLAVGLLGICGEMGLINDNKPTAIDVYRGKTTLEITYKDSVAIDSIVVFK